MFRKKDKSKLKMVQHGVATTVELADKMRTIAAKYDITVAEVIRQSGGQAYEREFKSQTYAKKTPRKQTT